MFLLVKRSFWRPGYSCNMPWQADDNAVYVFNNTRSHVINANGWPCNTRAKVAVEDM